MVNLGDLLITNRAQEVLNKEDIIRALANYAHEDYGLVDDQTIEMNTDSIINNTGTIYSHFIDRKSNNFYIITDIDEKITTILLPSEY